MAQRHYLPHASLGLASHSLLAFAFALLLTVSLCCLQALAMGTAAASESVADVYWTGLNFQLLRAKDCLQDPRVRLAVVDLISGHATVVPHSQALPLHSHQSRDVKIAWFGAVVSATVGKRCIVMMSV